MRIGVLCASEIAKRRFMPALLGRENWEYMGIALNSAEERFPDITDITTQCAEQKAVLAASREKAEAFAEQYGGKIYDSYEKMLSSDDIEAVYIPLPPALHFKWARLALENGKHVLLEKPSTTCAADTAELIRLAEEKNLALHENYMFCFHEQMTAVKEIVQSGRIGDVRLYRISFGFPKRAANDFRYNKGLGGGALIDAGGYTLKCGAYFLGDTAAVKQAQVNYTEEFDVDIYGSGCMVNEEGVTAQLSYGMDNSYKCDLEIWGSKGCFTTGRILTAPVGFVPKAVIKDAEGEHELELPADDAFGRSIDYFGRCIENRQTREESYNAVMKQAERLDAFRKLAGME